ncbi:MAG TPA: DNA replication/repair protein RecF [Clostridiaceae bacterium]|nr:DNA replication/repair protein RecF [Clostridiaceae bacterium]
MRVTKIELKNFRNYSYLVQEFYPGAQILYGNNAQGKTNILESIYLCTCARSHRTGKDIELVQQGKDDYDVKISFVTDKSIEEEIRIHYLATVSGDPLRTKPIRHIYHNGVRLERVGDMMGLFNAVIFAPEDLQLIKDGPSARRRFVDLLISQLYPPYFRDLLQYQHLLTQRNNLLKKLRDDFSTGNNTSDYDLNLAVWDEQIADCSSRIISLRYETVSEIDILANEAISQITGLKEELRIRYKTVGSITRNSTVGEVQQIMKMRLWEQAADDILRGYTCIGPHRDDLVFSLNGNEVRPFASQGQQRSVVLSLKLAELLLLRRRTGESPVLLLDDVMSELDGSRRYRLLQTIDKHQSFITSTELSQVLHGQDTKTSSLADIVDDYSIFEVDNATVTKILSHSQ